MESNCPECGNVLPAMAAFCGRCGHHIEAPQSTVFECRSCGATQASNAKFCGSCGASSELAPHAAATAATTSVPQQPRTPEDARRLYTLIAIGCLAAIVLGAGLTMRFIGSGGADNVATTTDESGPTTNAPVESTVTGVSDGTTEASVPAVNPTVQPDSAPPTSVAVTVQAAPVVTTAATTTAVTTTTSVPATPTTFLSATPTTIPGDLALGTIAMTQPECDDSYITIVASAVDPAQYVDVVRVILGSYPGARYLRTDQTCPSLRAELDGAAIYVGYFGPYELVEAACSARTQGPSDAYVRILSQAVSPTHVVTCQ